MIIKDNILRDMAKLVAWYPLRWCVTTSPWRLAYLFGEAVGLAESLILRERNGRIAANLLATYGSRMTEVEAYRIAQRNIQRHYIEHMEFYKYATLNAANLSQHIRFEGLKNLDTALKAGRGAILVHMHYGCKQFPLVALGIRGYDVSQIGYRDANAEDHSWVHKNVHLRIRLRLENQFNVKHVHVGKSLRPAYETLKRNGILMITGDGIGGIRGAGENYISLPFLGRTMLFPPGPARMARTTGAVLLPLFCVQQPDFTHLAIIEAPIALQLTDDRKADVRHSTAEYTRVFETFIKRHPEHWMFWEEFQEGCLIPKAESCEGLPEPQNNDLVKKPQT
ncbi:MAG: lysophospholipid acyltransferase family protein [Smithellaceae bacterium]|jgi:KDO2-lipid IV(A) lauroyltransferase